MFKPVPKNELPEKVQKAIDSLVPDLKPIVERIEAAPKLTQNHYGDYMVALGSAVPDGNHDMLALVGYAMMEAGGNHQGIRDALRAHTGR